MIDRYLFYLIIYFIHNLIDIQHNYVMLLFITIPQIQNFILPTYFLDKYIQNKNIFIKYSISKMSVQFIQNLHPQIDTIQNYHIFIIYRILSVKFMWDIINNCLFISLLNLLRSYDSTYYYYKGIKMAYYYNVGYLYNVIPLSDAIYLTNIIIKEKRWRELEKVEVINAFFVLVMNKYELFSAMSNSFSVSCQMILFQLCSLYSIISVLKIVNAHLSAMSSCLLLISMATYLAKFNRKNIITSILIYFLITFNINDMLITGVIVTHTLIYYWLEEIYFFIKNISNVKKVIKMYESPSIELIFSKLKDEYVII